MIKVNDSIFIYNINNREHYEHILVNVKSKKQKVYFGNLNKRLKKVKKGYHTKFNQTRLVLKPDRERVAAIYSYLNKFKIYDSKGNLIKEIEIVNEAFKDKTNLMNPFLHFMFNSETIATGKYIYILNPNISFEDRSQDYKYPNSSISVWDWNGNPIAKYTLDQPISSFDISEKYNKIFAVSTIRQNVIYEYVLPI